MASHCVLSWISILLSIITPSTAEPYIYDGISTVTLDGLGKKDWTLKYPVGDICGGNYWYTNLTINVITTTPNQADLVFAFGTQDEYMASIIPYDGGFWVWGDAPTIKGSLFVYPYSGLPLAIAPTGLETQYATDDDPRHSLVGEGEDPPLVWEKLLANHDPLFAYNYSPLKIELFGDRVNGITTVTLIKAGKAMEFSYSSTWNSDDEQIYLYMGFDAIHAEVFQLSGIERDDFCNAPKPSGEPTPAPTADTMQCGETITGYYGGGDIAFTATPHVESDVLFDASNSQFSISEMTMSIDGVVQQSGELTQVSDLNSDGGHYKFSMTGDVSLIDLGFYGYDNLWTGWCDGHPCVNNINGDYTDGMLMGDQIFYTEYIAYHPVSGAQTYIEWDLNGEYDTFSAVLGLIALHMLL